MYVHGDNLKQKENHQTKYRDKTSVSYLKEIWVEYNKWKKSNEDLKSPHTEKKETDLETIKERVRLFS